MVIASQKLAPMPVSSSTSNYTSEVHLSRRCAMSWRVKVPGVGVGYGSVSL